MKQPKRHSCRRRTTKGNQLQLCMVSGTRRSGSNNRPLGLLLFLLFIPVLALSGCLEGSENVARHSESQFIMDTLVNIEVYGAEGEEVIKKSMAEIGRLEDLMSMHQPDTEVSRINASAGQEPVPISAETFHVLRRAKHYARLTDGAFDPTIAPIVQLWGIGSPEQRVPEQGEIASELENVDYRELILDAEEQTAFLRRQGAALDIGGIAKGYAADRVRDIFAGADILGGYIDIGGNVIVYGSKPDETDWGIGIQDPRGQRGEVVISIPISESKSIVTSGDYERYFEEDGRRYHHIFDTSTGKPARTDLTSATAITGLSVEADALSTCLFLLGSEKALELAQDKEDVEAILLTRDREILATPGIRERINLLDEGYEIEESR